MVLEWEVLDKTPVFAPFVVYCLLFMNFQEGISLSLRCASFWVLTLFLGAGVLLIWSLYFYCMKIVDICDPTVTFLFTGLFGYWCLKVFTFYQLFWDTLVAILCSRVKWLFWPFTYIASLMDHLFRKFCTLCLLNWSPCLTFIYLFGYPKVFYFLVVSFFNFFIFISSVWNRCFVSLYLSLHFTFGMS